LERAQAFEAIVALGVAAPLLARELGQGGDGASIADLRRARQERLVVLALLRGAEVERQREGRGGLVADLLRREQILRELRGLRASLRRRDHLVEQIRTER